MDFDIKAKSAHRGTAIEQNGDYLELHTADGVDIKLSMAGIGSRSYAFLIDWHIRFIVSLAWFFLLGVLFLGTESMREFFLNIIELSSSSPYLVLIPGLAIYFLYHPVLEIMMGGRTPGKRMAGIKIVNRQGLTPGTGQLLTRNIFRLVDAIPLFYLLGLIACLVTRRHVRIGDLAASTLLIYEESLKNSALANGLSGITKHDFPIIDVAKELSERWPSLDRKIRHALATKLLCGINAEFNCDRLNDKELRQAVEDLYNHE